MMNEQSDFDAGHKAGMNAVLPLTPFEMSQYADDFKVGYVVALAEIHSVRCASPSAAGGEAAEMGQKYRNQGAHGVDVERRQAPEIDQGLRRNLHPRQGGDR
jgi:hypothetical protein